MSKQDRVQELIIAAFADALRPPAQDIALGDSLEAAMIRNYLASRTWREVSTRVLEDYDARADLSALPAFLSGGGFRYYLPALLLYVIDRGQYAGLLIDTTVDALASDSKRYSSEQFSEKQRRAIDEFLSYLGERHSEDSSLVDAVQLARRRWH